MNGGNELDRPFQPAERPSEMVEGLYSGGVIVKAGVVTVAGQPTPCLVYEFARADGSGFDAPRILVLDEDQMVKHAQLIASAVAAAVRVASDG